MSMAEASRGIIGDDARVCDSTDRLSEGNGSLHCECG